MGMFVEGVGTVAQAESEFDDCVWNAVLLTYLHVDAECLPSDCTAEQDCRLSA